MWLAVTSKILVEGTDHGVTEQSPNGPPFGGDLESGEDFGSYMHVYLLSLQITLQLPCSGAWVPPHKEDRD